MFGTFDRIGQASPSMRSIEVEQAAHTLRQRLAIATSHQAQSPHSLTVQFLRENGFSTTPVSTETSASSSLSPSTTHTSVSGGDYDPSGVQGLGIGTTDGEGDVDMQLHRASSSTAQRSTLSPGRYNAKAPQPSLYDAIFGPLVGRIAMPSGSSQQGDLLAVTKSGVSVSPVAADNQQRSPHVRQGSSAFLEQVALSPQVGSPHHMAPSPRQLAAERELFKDILHDTPMLSLYDSPSQPWSSANGAQSPASSQFSWASARRHSRQGSHAVVDASAQSHQPSAYGHKRLRSLGGSVLPNGHPASSLAQDLGLASGGHGRTPRSRNPSATNGEMPNSRSTARTDQESMAGFLLANLASPLPRAENENGHNTGGNTPGRTSTSAFVDPNFATPRRRQRTSAGEFFTPPAQMASLRHSDPRSLNHLDVINEGHNGVEGSSNEAAAHMLLDLAASPSRNSSHARFPGHTPSLQDDLVPARRLSATPSRASGARGHARIRSMGDVRIFAPDTPPSALRNGSQSRTPSQVGRVRLLSPPITPPDSDDVRSSDKTEQGDRAGMLRSMSPVSPSRRQSAPDSSVSSLRVPAAEDDALPITPTQEMHDPLHDDGQSKVPMETPRTPPLKASTPRTPKAPGSNFSYGDFLHVSPSPQPRMRTESALTHPPVTETPTRATRSRARFLDFSQTATGASTTATNGEHDGDAASDEECMFTVGQLPARRVSTSAKGPGLGDALELRESHISTASAASSEQFDAALLEAHVLVPGKRAAMVIQPTPSSTSKRQRAAALS